MNRLIFVRFIEDEGVCTQKPLEGAIERYDPTGYTRSLYKGFIEPLFFDVLNTKPSNRHPQIKNIGFYQGVPYLNGGLFRSTHTQGHKFDDREFDVDTEILEDILAMLENYTFAADGGVENLDPSVLGNVFEKTVNHITSSAGDQKKELGAYYTPDEITRFCAEQTVQPAILERLKDQL